MKFPKIQALRQKSKSARDRIALAVAGTVTALVFAVWVVADPAGIAETVTAVEEAEQPRMFGGLIDQVREQVAGVREAIERGESAPQAATSSNQIIMPEMPQATPPGPAPATEAATSSDTDIPREIQLYIEAEATTSASMETP